MKRVLRNTGLGLLALAATAAFAPPASAAAPVVVTLWSWTPVAPTMKAMVAAIEKAHPGIQVRATIQPHTADFTAMKAAAASGTLPDIIGLPPGAYTQEYRPYLQDLTATATGAWGADWTKNFAPSLLAEARLGNPKGDAAYYMLPQEAQVLNIWYNRAIFKKAGIAAPPKTMGELVADAKKIRAKGLIPFYQGGATGLFDGWVYMQIAAQTDLKGLLAVQQGAPVWTQPGMIKAAKVWQTLFTAKVVQAGALSALQYPTGANLFAAGRVGMISLGSWWLQETGLSSNPALKTMSGYGKFFFPGVAAGAQPSPPIGGVDIGWGMTKNAAKSPAVEAATKVVIKELISGVAEQIALNQLNDLPAFNGMKPQQALSPHLQGLYDSYIQELATAHPHAVGNPVIFQTLVSNLQAIGAGSKTPEAAMAAVQKVAQAQAAK
ncbi:MAG TPA: extracellular solute-binding protein [Acetobacteraceae bacterium]|nr:extracellular solute-binding protein [Acetobacteraceae bacterium]